jgi:nicotinamidase-related amidase
VVPEPDAGTNGLLVLDYQVGYFRSVPGAELLYSPGLEPLLPRLRSVIGAARACGVRVYYVMVEFAPGHPEVGRRAYAGFQMCREQGLFRRGNAETPIHPEVAPEPGDVVIAKHRVGAFCGTDLDRILRGDGVERIVIAGLATKGAVLSTMRHGSDLDYAITILEDLCGDHDHEAHRVLMEKVFPSQATVTTSEDWLRSIGAAS